MTGNVRDHQPVVDVTFRTPGQPVLAIEFVVDTGFVGFLTVPPAAIAALGLPFGETISANLADDSTIAVDL